MLNPNRLIYTGKDNTYQESLLMNTFRNEMDKEKDPSMKTELENIISYPTTFLPLDYANGMHSETEDLYKNRVYAYDGIGVSEGSIIMLIGKPGCGKTTLAMQMASSIISRFPNSQVLHEDLEGAATIPRISTLTGWGTRLIKSKYLTRNKGINTDNFFKRINVHVKTKLDLAEKFPGQMTYNTWVLDDNGKFIHRIIPSVVILDSLPLLSPADKTKEEELSGNMNAAAVAKLNTQIFKRLTPTLKMANVILIVINHINQNININPFAPKQAQINYLKQDEVLPGGTAALYLANNIFKVTTSSKYDPSKGFGINGWDSKIDIVKSRTNRAGQTVNLVYNQEYGFDRMLSTFKFLKDNDRIKGSGAWFYLDGLPQMKFQQKQFYEKFVESKAFRLCMKELTTDLGKELLTANGARGQDMTEDEIGSRIIDSFKLDVEEGYDSIFS